LSRPPLKIISGGQTGVDRAALDAAIELGIPHGGYCPRGRRAEDGRIPDCYQLVENDSSEYRVRTEQNVLNSDATLILCRGPLMGGTKVTRRFTRQHGRPCLVIDLQSPPARDEIDRWLQEHGQKVLNIAGPRESQSPGIHAESRAFLLELWPLESRL
jgi:hypothetical protein